MAKFSRRRNSKKRKSVKNRKLRGGGDDNNKILHCIRCNILYIIVCFINVGVQDVEHGIIKRLGK
jgi:hypothetical protein